MEQGVDEGAGFVADGGVHDEAGLFVDDDDVGVFVENFDGDVFGLRLDGDGFGNLPAVPMRC